MYSSPVTPSHGQLLAPEKAREKQLTAQLSTLMGRHNTTHNVMVIA